LRSKSLSVFLSETTEKVVTIKNFSTWPQVETKRSNKGSRSKDSGTAQVENVQPNPEFDRIISQPSSLHLFQNLPQFLNPLVHVEPSFSGSPYAFCRYRWSSFSSSPSFWS
jgi:hypothetical protein